MASYLESVPSDVLQHIAFLAGSSSTFDPPVALFHFLQTSSTIYQSLNVRAAPHLYSDIFSTKFDMQAARRRYHMRLPDSIRCTELLSRSRLLRRSHRVDLTSDGLTQDLWTALWMVLENDDLNIRQLCHTNFCHFLLSLAHVILLNGPGGRNIGEGSSNSRTAKNIVLWLLCLSLPRRTFLDMLKEDREEFYALIFPYMCLGSKDKTSVPRSLSVRVRGHENQGYPGRITVPGPADSSFKVKNYHYLQSREPLLPDASIAAINLAFVYFETNTILKIPPHFPETRAIALATLRSGPTQDDYRTMARYQTKLLADPPSSSTTTRLPSVSSSPVCDWSTNNDMLFGDILQTLSDGRCGRAFQYNPGILSGLWEGVFRTVESPIGNSAASTPTYQNALFSMGMIKPMQCHLVEYICQSPDDGSQEEISMDHDLLATDICSPDQFDFTGSVKHDTEITFKGRKYNKHIPQTDTNILRRNPLPTTALHDVIVLGEVGFASLLFIAGVIIRLIIYLWNRHWKTMTKPGEPSTSWEGFTVTVASFSNENRNMRKSFRGPAFSKDNSVVIRSSLVVGDWLETQTMPITVFSVWERLAKVDLRNRNMFFARRAKVPTRFVFF